MTHEQLKASILQYAIQGKLVEQRPEEGTGEELYHQIQEEKQRLIKEKKIKKEKPLVEITDNEIPFDIPETWVWIRVGDIGSWGSGATPSRTNPAYYGGSIPWLKSGSKRWIYKGSSGAHHRVGIGENIRKIKSGWVSSDGYVWSYNRKTRHIGNSGYNKSSLLCLFSLRRYV